MLILRGFQATVLVLPIASPIAARIFHSYDLQSSRIQHPANDLSNSTKTQCNIQYDEKSHPTLTGSPYHIQRTNKVSKRRRELLVRKEEKRRQAETPKSTCFGSNGEEFVCSGGSTCCPTVDGSFQCCGVDFICSTPEDDGFGTCQFRNDPSLYVFFQRWVIFDSGLELTKIFAALSRQMQPLSNQKQIR